MTPNIIILCHSIQWHLPTIQIAFYCCLPNFCSYDLYGTANPCTWCWQHAVGLIFNTFQQSTKVKTLHYKAEKRDFVIIIILQSEKCGTKFFFFNKLWQSMSPFACDPVLRWIIWFSIWILIWNHNMGKHNHTTVIFFTKILRQANVSISDNLGSILPSKYYLQHLTKCLN